MADSKVSALTELSVPALEDLAYLVDDPAGTPASVKCSLNRLLGLLPGVCNGRLTLVSDNPSYSPQAATPSSTDTTAETVTFASAHGWVTGTMVTPYATGGGLTAGTVYWVRAVSSTVVSFHGSFADADSNSSPINLSASITSQLIPLGVTWDNLYFTPYGGNRISLYDGTRWKLYSFNELTLALSGLTSGKNYDVFVYDNAGTLTLELSAAWTDATTRADALALQDGVYVKSGSTTRRYVGTIRTTGTTTVEDSSAKRFVWNNQNRVQRRLFRDEPTSTWTYTTDTWRQANGSSANQVEVVTGFASDAVQVALLARATNSSATIGFAAAIGLDSTSAPAPLSQISRSSLAASEVMVLAVSYAITVAGYHYFTWLERSVATGTTTWTGRDQENRASGLVGICMA